MGFIDHDEVVKTFGSNGPNHPLGDGVRLRRSWRRPHARDVQLGQPLIKVPALIRIPVVDQEFRLPT